MIYTLTLNPSLDYHLHAPHLTLGTTNRAAREDLTFGGKGINVSVVLTRLGVPNVALGFVAGFTGDELCARLSDTGIIHDIIRLEGGMTRVNVKLHAGEETEINTSGPVIPSEAMEALMHKLGDLNGGDTLVLSGSIPPALPRDAYAAIMARVAGKGIRCVVDAEGEVLTATLLHRPFLIKPNLRELSALVGKELITDEDILSAARDLQTRGARNVLVSLGGRGAILLDEDGGRCVCPALGGASVSTVGAGDSMVAGFLAGLPEGYDSALRLGLAAGGATACTEGLGTREEILHLYQGRLNTKSYTCSVSLDKKAQIRYNGSNP